MLRLHIGLLVVVLGAGCAHVSAPVTALVAGARVAEIDDQAGAAQIGALDVPQYIGRWERVHGAHDGRSLGTSTRSFHRGDALQMNFVGSGVTVRGIAGPNGGRALIGVDREAGRYVDFYAPRKRVDGVTWKWNGGSSRELHTLVIVVAGTHDPQSRGDYVNIDDLMVARD